VRWATSGESGPWGDSPNVLSFCESFTEKVLFMVNTSTISLHSFFFEWVTG
jgi:hypothetical protein